MSSSGANEIKSLQNSITDMWEPTKSTLEGRQADDALLKTFFTTWEDLMKKGESNVEGYRDAVAQIEQGSPGIPKSGLTESQLLEKIEKILGKPLDPPDQFKLEDFGTDGKDGTGIKKKLRDDLIKWVALGFFCDSQIKNLNNKIEQLNKRSNDPMYGESPDAGVDRNFLS
ncbi:MAG: hypothetical protein A3I68_03200 [Candidatus Melainabacteria bacterium RIFCSPLOWO2_02_FULL_35_15]|nr:MAG: hypothetical protein A3F80_05265 [Candidatus Melainabacteria bacterium RIFCSPLOWO2_12_FULL_35_11]OGI13092.1 MAG: hypothetical protein A3I68_03200 [Candidatus Melainabacteria bacterium RIFCSPLOWO2_02_FULL_35_15]